MLKFTKGFVPNNQTKIATNYIKMTPIDRINIIIVTNIDTFSIFFSLVICFFNDINTGINKIKL